MKKLREIVEATKSLHPMALHVKPVMVNGQQKYKVHAVGNGLADGIKHGEHLSDSELDDAHEMGAKVKHVKEDADLDEARKLEGTYTHTNGHQSKVYKLSGEHHEGDPYHVKLFKGGKHYEPADYFTNDKDDAHSTAKHMVKEAMSHQAKTTMKHIPNASPALKKAAKDIKPGIMGYADRIAMLKAGGVKESTDDIETTRQFRNSIAGVKARSAIDKAKDGPGAKYYADGAKVTPQETARRAAEAKAKKDKQDVKTLKGNIQRNEETNFGPEADKNITVQLKKAMDMMEHGEKTGSDIEFADGQKHFVEGVIAHKVLVAMEQMKPEVRAQAQNAVYQSFAHLMAAHQMLSK